MVTELTDANFQSTLQTAKVPVLVDFSASWCQPCKALAPTIDKVAGEYQGKMAVYKIDIDSAQDTALTCHATPLGRRTAATWKPHL